MSQLCRKVDELSLFNLPNGLFTVGEIDNNDHKTSYSASIDEFCGIERSAFQLPTQKNSVSTRISSLISKCDC